MHLLEALLALWECSGHGRYLARAGTLCDLFATRFFRTDPGILDFTETPAPALGIAGEIVEPGHHYVHAERFGFDEGRIVDELLVDGSPHRRSRRIWPISEAIRANLVEARLGRPGSAARAVSLAALLRQRFLATDPAGGWLDRLDAGGGCIAKFMPASTLDHLVGAIDELLLSADDPGRVPRGSDPGSATRCRALDRSTAG